MRIMAIRILLIAFGLAAVTHAETVQHEPAFEVASIRITPGGVFAISPVGQERFSIRNVSLLLLISMAFGVSDAQVLGGPGWRESEHYDVTAKAEPGIKLTYEELRPRLRDLLARRFKLAVHREIKDVSGYALVVDRQGSRLKRSTVDSSTFGAILAGALRAESISMDAFAAMVGRVVGRPVTNQTGLSGNYEMALNYAPEASTDSTLPSIFTALQEQAGLKLEPRKVPQEMIVIDHVEHPTED